jgi:hypothetical protein
MNLNDLLLEAVRRGDILAKQNLSVKAQDLGDAKARYVLSHLTDAQLEFVTSPARMKAALCTRRAGKSTGAAAGMIYTALRYSNCSVAYFAPTSDDARGVMHDKLEELHEQYGINISWHEQRAEFSYPNGSVIKLVGANDARGSIRGLGRAFHLVVIDEAASFGKHFASLVTDTLLPTLADYGGALWMIGTPQPLCLGYFHDVTTGQMRGWELFTWSVFDNPMLPAFRAYAEANPGKDWKEYAYGEWLDYELGIAGLTREDTSVQRMWFAKWVRDNTSLVYQYDPVVNDLDAADKFSFYGWKMVLGVDLGQNSALTLVAYADDMPYCVIIKSQRYSITLTDELGKLITAWRLQYPKIGKVIVDIGNVGKQIAEDLRVRWRLPIVAATKKDKLAYQITMNSDFRTGRIKVWAAQCKNLIAQWQSLQKDPDTGEEIKGGDNHETDAALYAWRFCRHFFFREKQSVLDPQKPEDLELIIENRVISDERARQKVSDELELLYYD